MLINSTGYRMGRTDVVRLKSLQTYRVGKKPDRHAVAHLHFHLPKFIDPENWPANSQYLNPVDFSVWGALQQKLYR